MKLDLYIPGLLAVPARLEAQLELPEAPALRSFVQRATTRETAPGRHGYILERLATPRAPLAALAWLGATGKRPVGTILRAAPVHLQAGMNDVVLFSGRGLQVSARERDALGRDIAAFLDGEPALRVVGGEWFLEPPRPLDVRTTPLYEVLGRTVRANLPQGADAGCVHAWMNEVQMFLHGHAVNAERAAAGLPPLNGVWLWGEGSLPEEDVLKDSVLFAESAVMQGLGVLLGEAREPCAFEDMLPASGRHVIEVSACLHALDADDAAGWRQAVATVSAEVLQPVLDWLARHPGAEAVLYAGDGKARTVRGRYNWLQRAFRRKSVPQLIEE